MIVQTLPPEQPVIQEDEGQQAAYEIHPGRNQVELIFSQETDLEKSLVLLDGIQVELKDHQTIVKAAPGLHELSFRLIKKQEAKTDDEKKDEPEEKTDDPDVKKKSLKEQKSFEEPEELEELILYEGIETVEIETVFPEITLIHRKKEADGFLFLNGKTKIEILADLQDPVIEAEIDGQKVKAENGTIEIPESAGKLTVKAADEFGTSSRKTITFVSLPDWSSQRMKGTSILVHNGDLSIEFKDSLPKGIELRAEGKTIDVSGKRKVSLHLNQDKEGMIELHHEKLGLLETIPVYNLQANPFLDCSVSFLEKSDSFSVIVEAADYESLEAVLYENGQPKSLGQGTFTLSGKPGEITSYQLEVKMKDVFGQSSSCEKSFQHDRRIPSGSWMVNSAMIENKGRYTFPVLISEQLTSLCDEVKTEYFINEKQVQAASLRQAFGLLSSGQSMQVKTVFANTNKKQAELEFELVYQPLEHSIEAGNGSLTIQMDSAGKIQVAQTPGEMILPAMSAQIVKDYEPVEKSELKSGDVVRIYLESDDPEMEMYFVSLKVNGQEISLDEIKVNELNQPYYDLKIEDESSLIEIEAMDRNGNQISAVKTIQAEKQQISFWQRILDFFSSHLSRFFAGWN